MTAAGKPHRFGPTPWTCSVCGGENEMFRSECKHCEREPRRCTPMTAAGKREDDAPKITVCAGPPDCLLQGDEALENIEAGCPTCLHIVVHPDGTETTYRKPSH